MTHKPLTIFVSSSRDMSDWSAYTVEHVRQFAARHGLADLDTIDYRDIDPAHLDHSATWQDCVGAPSSLGVVMTIVLIGERIGTPLTESFQLRNEIHKRLRKAGYEWVHVAGVDPLPPQPDQVPLTGVLFELFDALLPRMDGSRSGSLRVLFKGAPEGSGEPDFGHGEYRMEIEALRETAQKKRELRYEYNQQLEWLNLVWRRLYGQQQLPCLFCSDTQSLQDQLERILIKEFHAQEENFSLNTPAVDARSIELPGPAPYDVATASLFFGRGPQLAVLARRAMQHEERRRLVPVIGESGAGKSSLLRAGLLNDVRSRSRRYLGWRSAFLSLAECPAEMSPLIFLAHALAHPAALPELGPTDAISQRLDGVEPVEAARRLLEMLADVRPVRDPGRGAPRLLIVVDQLELAVDKAQVKSVEEAQKWIIFLHTLASLGGALRDPEAHKILDHPAEELCRKLPFTVVLGLPADRFESLGMLMRPGEQVFPLPRLVDETAVREVIVQTFATLGLSIEPKAREGLTREAVKLAIDSEASILPLLSVALSGLHNGWKERHRILEAWKRNATPGDPFPKAFRWIGISPPEIRGFDIAMQHVSAQGEIGDSIEYLGELAWKEAEARESLIRMGVESLPVSLPRARVRSGDLGGREFALAWLLRHLVSVSADEKTPDRLTDLRDSLLPEFARPMAEALLLHRILTRREDGTWWLVHEAVIKRWKRAATWREEEIQLHRTLTRMEFDRRRWLEEKEEGEADADRWLWTKGREIERAFDWMGAHGMTELPEIAAFIKAGSVAAIHKDPHRAGRILRAATFYGDVGWVREILLASGEAAIFAVNYVESDRGCPLFNCCHHASNELVELLLEKGANPNIKTSSSWTALILAAQNGQQGAVVRLIAAGANVQAATEQGFTALTYAAQGGYLGIIHHLLAAGSDINHATNDGHTATMLACKNGHEEVVAALIVAGADVNLETNREGTEPSPGRPMFGPEGEAIEPVKQPTQATGGITALLYAAANGHDAVALRLMAAGANPRHESSRGLGTLIFAAENGHTSMVSLLIDAGVEVDEISDRISTPDRKSSLIVAAEQGHTQVVDRLILAGAAIDGVDINGRSALIAATEKGKIAVVEALVHAGANINLRNNDGRTSLMISITHEHESIFARMLASEANLEIVDKAGDTALVLAAHHKKTKFVERLVTAGAEVNRPGNRGSTPLMESVKARDEAMCRFLLDRGADLTCQDDEGLSAIDIARRIKVGTIVRILEIERELALKQGGA